jgi:hypothetical protein
MISRTVDRHLTAYMEMIRRGQCEEVVELARTRLWLDELGLAEVDRVSTIEFLDRLIECLELQPKPDLRGAQAAIGRARRYWQHPERHSL